MRPVNNNVTCENEHKRRRHQMISAPTVETVTTACKKIRLIGTERSTTMNKRQCESSLMVTSEFLLMLFKSIFILTNCITIFKKAFKFMRFFTREM